MFLFDLGGSRRRNSSYAKIFHEIFTLVWSGVEEGVGKANMWLGEGTKRTLISLISEWFHSTRSSKMESCAWFFCSSLLAFNLAILFSGKFFLTMTSGLLWTSVYLRDRIGLFEAISLKVWIESNWRPKWKFRRTRTNTSIAKWIQMTLFCYKIPVSVSVAEGNYVAWNQCYNNC